MSSRILRRAALVSLGSAFSGLASCGRSPATNGSDDSATVDAKAPDGAETMDASSDALSDSNSDALRDAAPPLPGSWELIDTICGATRQWIATAPSEIEVDTWEPCTSGRPGCDRLKTPWAKGYGPALAPGLDTGGVLGSSAVTEYVRLHTLPSEAVAQIEVQVIQTHEGKVLAAIASDGRPSPSPGCGQRATYGPYGLVFASDAPEAVQLTLFPAGSLTKPKGALKVAFADISSSGSPLSGAAVGMGAIFLGTSKGPLGVAAVDLGSGAVSGKVTSSDVPCESPIAHKDAAIAGSYTGIVRIEPSGKKSVLHTLGPGRQMFMLQVDRQTDKIVWVDGIPGSLGAKDVVLWQAAWVSTATEFVAKRVTGIDSPTIVGGLSALAVNDGLVVFKYDEREYRLHRLEDGRGWKVAAEATDSWTIPFDVTKTYLRIGTTKPPSKSLTIGMVRLRVADLGEPTLTPT